MGHRQFNRLTDRISGAKSDRQQLVRLVKALEPRDILIVTRLDRLARSTRDLLNLVHRINEAAGQSRSLATESGI